VYSLAVLAPGGQSGNFWLHPRKAPPNINCPRCKTSSNIKSRRIYNDAEYNTRPNFETCSRRELTPPTSCNTMLKALAS